jgi:hypothetical protein
MGSLVERLKALIRDEIKFILSASGLELRGYQIEVARAVVDSVRNRRGFSFVVEFPRQSGKNELQAQIEVYLLTLYSATNCEIVKISPTKKPQAANSMRRIEQVLKNNIIVRGMWKKEEGYIYRVGKARIYFLSGSPEAAIVGSTAGTLLEIDEAQDILVSKYDKEIAPMVASTNATRVFWGTAWTSQTLLAREKRAALEAQSRDGFRRVFTLDADQVAREVPAYGAFVAEQISKLGRSHPFVKTQFFSETIDGSGGMFPAERVALMDGGHAARMTPQPGRVYGLLLDVAGSDEGGSDNGETGLINPRRDSTALTIVEVDLSGLSDPLIRLPRYLVVHRRTWRGVKQTELYGAVKALADLWRARYLVIDATGIGAGIAAFLEKSLPGRVIKFEFSTVSKSRLGWDFLGVVDSGRWKEAKEGRDEFYTQLENCTYEIIPGPQKTMKWGVSAGCRDIVSGDLLHDDLITCAALVCELDRQEWSLGLAGGIIKQKDVLSELDHGGFR